MAKQATLFDLGFTDEYVPAPPKSAGLSDLGFSDEAAAPKASPVVAPSAAPKTSEWAQKHPYLAKFLPDPTTSEYRENDRKIAHQQYMESEDEATAPKAAISGVKMAASGLHDVYTPTDAETRAGGGNSKNPDFPGAPMTAEEIKKANAKVFHGAAKVIAGGGTTALALDAPELIGMGSAALGAGGATAAETLAARVALAKIAVGFGAGYGASAGAGKVADKYQMTPEAKELLQTTAFFVPSLLGAGLGKAGFKSGIGVDPEGNFGAGVSSPDSGFVAGGRVTPEAYEAGIKVGDTRFTAKVPRKPTSGSPEIAAGETSPTGGAPVHPEVDLSSVPPPKGMAERELNEDTVANVAAVVKAAPKDAQEATKAEAQQNLTKWILEAGGTFTGPDGKEHTAEIPEHAEELATKILDDALDQHAEKVEDHDKEAIDHQVAALKQGDVKAVKLPEDSTYTPPKGLRKIEAGGDTFVYDPQKVSKTTILEASKAGTLDALLGREEQAEAAPAPKPVPAPKKEPPAPAVETPAAKTSPAGNHMEPVEGGHLEHLPDNGGIVFHADKNAIRQEEEKPSEEPKYKFGTTQANLPPSSEAAKAIATMQDGIPEEDLAGNGKDVDVPHVTVRYGLKNGLTPELRQFIESQPPFEAKLGATKTFPPSENSNGASPVIAPVESPEFHRLNAEIEKIGDFEPSSFPDYKPHVTVAYVKPEVADNYTGMTGAEGKSFPVTSIAISDQNVEHTEIPLKGSEKDQSLEGIGFQEEKPVPENQEPLSEVLLGHIRDGNMPKDNNALKAIVAKYDGKAPDQVRMKEAQEAMEVALVERSRDIVHDGDDEREIFDELVKLYESQPNLNIRTTTSIENQAYSTPAPLAFVASELAGIDSKTKVYEPTAGNGMLLIGANPKKVLANELYPNRADALEDQGFKVMRGDALEAEVEPHSMDAIITNPPFGSVKGPDGKPTKVKVDGYKVGQIDHLIAARALDAMKDDGKASIILGANKVAGGISTDDRIFFNWLYSHYNVTSHFEVSGDLYARQGAGWPVRVINVNGRIRSDRFSPKEGTIERVGTWEDVYGQFDKSMAAQQSRYDISGAGGAVERPADDTTGVRTAPPGTTTAGSGSESEAGGTVANWKPGVQPKPLPSSEIESAGGLASTDNDVRPDADAARSDRLARGERREPPARRDAKPSGVDRGSLTPADNEFQVAYTPASSKKDVGILIPKNMRDPLEQAMMNLEDQVGDIDEFVADELGYADIEELHDAFMGLQIDSVAAAIHQIRQGRGAIIADMTGVGKGRQAAAIIRWAVLHGKTPIFMSAKPSLFTDMYGDLTDIGSDDIQPFIVNVDESITLPNGEKAFQNTKSTHRAAIENIQATGELPDGKNAIFLTYSQINTDNKQRNMLSAIAHKAVVIMDESHSAAGDSSTGAFMQGIVAQANGVVYLSATFAKRPDNMPLYFKTDMGQAISDPKKLEGAMAMGGLPLQTVVSNNLVKAGQFFRRERSYDGVDIRTITDTPRKAEHTKIADGVTEALRAIVDADHAFHEIYVPQAQAEVGGGGSVAGGGNDAEASVNHTEFTSVVHNFVRQMLLGLKADAAADEAIAAIKEGKKPLIAVELTMGSFLSEYAAAHNIKDGQSLGDFSYRNVLNRALVRTRALQHTDAQGNKTRIEVSYNQLDPYTQSIYDKAQAVIDKLEMDLPVSPIDWIRQRITGAGYKIAEVTGRSLAVDYENPKNPKLSAVSAQEQNDKVETTRRFNDGRLDAIILNVSGSTGISLHASEKFADQRPRHMIVAQPAQDINVFMQMLGRVHRTGQVALPSYTLQSVDLPAEKRPTALLSKKMKSLNANTSSNTESATSVKAPDMLNKYGDEIVANYLEENFDLANLLGVEALGENGKPAEDIARKATGRLAILPVKVQELFYRDVEQQYNTYIEYLNDTNQNDLEPRTFDYDAKVNSQQVLSKGENPASPFGEDSIYGEYSIKAQSKPLSAEDVDKIIKDNLDGRTPEDTANGLISDLKGQLDAYIDSIPFGSVSRDTALTVADTASNFIRMHKIGSTLRVEVNGDSFSAAVTNVESTHKGHGNPFAMSKINVTLATTGPQPRIKIPATYLEKVIMEPLYASPQALFQMHRPPAREVAKIVTGNLLAAYGEMRGTKGTIISFSKEDGTIEMGILLPKKFNLDENTVGDYQMRSAEHVLNYLRNSTKPESAQLGVASRDGSVRVTRNGSGNLVVTVPKSKARGGKFFLDKSITALTGDFVSGGQSMRATVPFGNEKAAIETLLRKSALYVTKSMAEEAARLAPPKKESPGVILRSSLFGLDVAGEAAAKVLGTFYKEDIAPHMGKVASSATSAGKGLVAVLAPRAVANPDALDLMMALKGELAKKESELDYAFKGLTKLFDKLTEEQRIEFIDRVKTGQKQELFELQEIADMYRTADTAMHHAVVEAQIGNMSEATQRFWKRLDADRKAEFWHQVETGQGIAFEDDVDSAANGDADAAQRLRLQEIADGTLKFKENHMRVFWKVIPTELNGDGVARKSFQTGRKRPLQGDKGMLRQATLADISEGLERGGVPVTTNPQILFEMGQMSSLRYITAQKMWQGIKQYGLRKFVMPGKERPLEWQKINDRIAQVYFPASSGEGMIKGGEWYVEPSSARLLNNYLSRDLMRENVVGMGLMKFKNFSTGIELAMSPLHVVYETIEAVSSQMALGAMTAWNNGLRGGSLTQILKGAGLLAKSPVAPFTLARAGGSVIKTVEDAETFLKTPRGQALIKSVGDQASVVQMISDGFMGGLTLRMPDSYKTDSVRALTEAWSKNNYLGALLRTPFAASTLVMKPLFNIYIPRLKWGLFLSQYSEQLAENKDALASGDVTRAEIARKVVNTVENRFGEVNFDNFFWDNTFKSAMQTVFRSVTWKMGFWRGFTAAAGPEMKEAFGDPLKAMREDWKAGKKQRPAGEYFVPKLGQNQSWLLCMAVASAALGTVLAKIYSGKYPWEWMQEDETRGMTSEGAMLLETVHPRTGKTDPYTGLPVRMTLPTGIRDFEHAFRDSRSYVSSSMSGMTSHAIDTIENRDYFSNYVYDPNGTEYQKMAQMFSYNMPKPITVETYQEGKKGGDQTNFKLSLAGMTRASNDYDLTRAEARMRDLKRAAHIPLTPNQVEKYHEQDEQRIENPTRKELRKAIKEKNMDYAERMFKGMTYADAADVYFHYATAAEQKVLFPMLQMKRKNALKAHPEDRSKILAAQ